ncbi:MAG TPA: hypothetical protein ENJ99_07325, partial [Rhizobiales bacterium]|nr:hypothetical protein [Hyphomicrobiales bacterium]
MPGRELLQKNADCSEAADLDQALVERLKRRLWGPNKNLAGVAGSRNLLATPCLILSLDHLQDNIETMASLVAGAGKQLRPHAKAHKCLEIARRQLRAGAQGIAVATIGEAEIFSAGGIKNIL